MLLVANTRNKIYFPLLIVLAIVGCGELVCSAFSLNPTLTFRKDFSQEYLMAKAMLNGVDPYLPLQELGSMYSFPNKEKLFPHFSAHPPFMALIGLPFALLPYHWAASTWFLFEFFLIALSCRLLAGWWSATINPMIILLIAFSIFAWDPVFDEMIFGQLNSLLLVFLLCSWLDLNQNREIRGGIFLGLAISIKLLSWPIALFLLLRKRWHCFAAVTATTVSTNLLALFIIGSESFWRYYSQTGATVFPHWRAHEANFSLWSLGWRVFHGTHGKGMVMNLTAPLYPSPQLTETSSLIVPVVFLLLSFSLALRIRQFDLAFGFMICASILFSPITWNHYLLMCLIPIAIISRLIARQEEIVRPHWGICCLAIAMILMMIIPGHNTRELMPLFETHSTTGINGQVIHHLPFATGLITLVPLIAVLCLMGTIWLLDRVVPAEPIESEAQKIS